MTKVKSIKHLLSDGLDAKDIHIHNRLYARGDNIYAVLSKIDANYVAYISRPNNEKPVVEVLSDKEAADFFDDVLVRAYSSKYADLTPITEVNEVFIDQLNMYADDWHFAHVFDDGYYFSMLGDYDLSNMPAAVTHVSEIGK